MDNGTLSASQIIAFYNETLDGFTTDENQIVVKAASEIDFSGE